ncbi:MAG TPA: hypothetical protein VFA70_13285 [Dehalococcoidia bacterium]|nr:hypothetical protein [Dehalococcoidia bacterium]
MRRCTAHTVAAAAAVFVLLTTMPGTAGAQSAGAQSVITTSASVPAAQPTRVDGAVSHVAAVQALPGETLSPVSGIEYGDGLNVGPFLAVIDVAGLIALAYVVRRMRRAPGA